MDKLINCISQYEMIIVYVLIFIMGLLMLLVLLIDKKKRTKKDIEHISYIDDKDAKEKAINELKNIEEELKYEELLKKMDEKIEEKVNETETESVNEETTILNNYEKIREEEAIISFNELTKLNDKIFNLNEIKSIDDEGNEPITIDELKNKLNNTTPKEVTLMDFSIDKKFVSTPFISPIYGLEKPLIKEEIDQLEQTANIEKYEIEIRKTNEFLNTLKELKEKLNF